MSDLSRMSDDDLKNHRERVRIAMHENLPGAAFASQEMAEIEREFRNRVSDIPDLLVRK